MLAFLTITTKFGRPLKRVQCGHIKPFATGSSEREHNIEFGLKLWREKQC